MLRETLQTRLKSCGKSDIQTPDLSGEVDPRTWIRKSDPRTGEITKNPMYDEIQRRKKEGMFGRGFRLQIDDSGTRTWYGNKSGVEPGLANTKAGVRLRRLFDEMLLRAGLTEEKKGDSR